MPDAGRIRELLERPAESLNVEVKTWINPEEPEGVEKIVKAVFALRNRNGGFLLVGYNNRTMRPDDCSDRSKIRERFHADRIQSIISKYAASSFEVEVQFGESNGGEFPVIFVPEGVKVPVVVKRDLQVDGGKYLLREGDIYFRTLGANGMVRSSRLKPGDIGDLVEICFENREADIGRFLRRHLSGPGVNAIFSSIAGRPSLAPETLRSRSEKLQTRGEASFQAAVAARPSLKDEINLARALTMRVGLALEPEMPGSLPTHLFLDKIASGNPQYTGWPVWLDTRGFRNDSSRPYVKDDAWEALIVSLHDGWSRRVEFMLLDSKGYFFLRRVMQDDLSDKVTPGAELDVILMVYRVFEVLATGLSVARSCGWKEDTAKAGYAFQWSGLKGRKLSSWANPLLYSPWGSSPAVDDFAASYAEIPLDVPPSALGPYVSQVIAPLFAKFGGYQVSVGVVEECVRRVVERKL